VDPRRAVEAAGLLREIVKMEASEFGDLAIEALTLGALAIEYVEARESGEDLRRTVEARIAYLAAAHQEGKHGT